MKRNKFNLSFYRLLSMNMGQLVPIGCQEVLPGDTFDQSSSALIRVSPMLAPVMHPVQVRIHHFFVPNRIVWDGWEDFITGNSEEGPPMVNIRFDSGGSVTDYQGASPPNGGNVDINGLALAGYNLIWNEFYRDQDLQNERSATDNNVANCAWEKDYFTSARPFTQKGPDIQLPLGDKAPVVGIAKETQDFNRINTEGYETGGTGSVTYPSSVRFNSGSPTSQEEFWLAEDGENPGFPGVFADLSRATGVTVNDLRESLALQRYAENRARYGSRYTEYLRLLGVNAGDARLQRPEYLGGGKQTISFSEILQTAQDSDTPVGTLRGHGIGAVRTRNYRRFFPEHGYVHTLMSVRPRTMYAQQLPRTFLKTEKEDYWQRELQHIGQQPVYTQELRNNQAQVGQVFGFQDRYREYREATSGVAGDMRTTLNFWHLGRFVPEGTQLNDDFVRCVPSKRVHAVQNEDVLWVMAQHRVRARRLVSRSASPRIL